MDMTTYENKKAILTINPHALQGLHNLIGYDFQQPHTIACIEGRFTLNSVLKTIGGANENNVVSLLCVDHNCGWSDRLHLVTVEMDFTIPRANIEHKGGYTWGLACFHMKGMFEDCRKSNGAECFIIAQDREHIHKPQEKPFDPSARYEYIPGKDSRCGDGRGASWIDRITVKDIDGKGELHEVTKHGTQYKFSRIIYRSQNESRPQSHIEIIDKSGYILPQRREQLRRRADNLRRDRAKAAYQATDDTAKVDELRAMIEAKKQHLIAMVEAATTSEDLRKIRNAISDSNGLMWTLAEFERFEDKTARRDYVSIHAAEAAYNSIKSALEKEVC